MKEGTLLDYWIILYTRKKLIIFITIVSIITSVVLSLLFKPVYEAKAVFYVPSSSPALSYLSTNAADKMARDVLVPTPKEEVFGPYIGLLKSKKIAEYVNKEFPRKKVEKLLLSDTDFELSNEFMLKIYSRDKDPVLAADVANAYMKYLNLLLQEASLENLKKDNFLIEKNMSETQKQLVEAEDALKKHEEKYNIASIDEEIKQLTSQRTSFQSQIETTDVQIKEDSEKIRSLSEQLKKEGILVAREDFTLTNPLIEYLQKKLSDLSTQISASSVELKESHPDVRMLKNQHKETMDRLKQEVQNLVSSQIKPTTTFYEQLRQNLVNLVIDRDKLQATTKGYREVIKRINERLLRLPSIKEEWNRLNDDVQRYKKVYEQLKMNIQEAGMQQARPIQYIVVVDYAKPPEDPAYPVLWLNIVVSLLCGVLAGIVWAFFRDYIEKAGKIRKQKIIKAILSED